MRYRNEDFTLRNKRIFADEFDAWIPPKVLDIHMHIISSSAVPGGVFHCAGEDLPKWDFDDFGSDMPNVFPGREVSALCFGWPDPTFDLAANNAYLAAATDRRRTWPLRLLSPAESPADVERDIEQGRFLGFKPYPDFVGGNPADVEIDQMLPPWAMDIANRHGLLIMLHIPRPGRIADPLNQEQLRRLCGRYPQADIVLAHIGRAYWLANVRGNLDGLRDIPNLHVDTTMVTHWEVIEHAMERLRPDQLLFGSDAPLALRPGKSIEINNGYTYVTPDPWRLSIHDVHQKLDFTSFLYEELRAIARAASRLGLGPDYLHDVMWTNGMRLIEKRTRHPSAAR